MHTTSYPQSTNPVIRFHVAFSTRPLNLSALRPSYHYARKVLRFTPRASLGFAKLANDAGI